MLLYELRDAIAGLNCDSNTSPHRSGIMFVTKTVLVGFCAANQLNQWDSATASSALARRILGLVSPAAAISAILLMSVPLSFIDCSVWGADFDWRRAPAKLSRRLVQGQRESRRPMRWRHREPVCRVPESFAERRWFQRLKFPNTGECHSADACVSPKLDLSRSRR